MRFSGVKVRCGSAHAFRRGLFSALMAFGLLLGIAPAAHADICDVLRAQLRSSSGGPQSPAVAQLNKQLAAIRALERQRQCSGKSKGGFFNACGDLARRKDEVERKIQVAARSKGGSGAAIRARMNDLGCITAVARKSEPRTSAAPMAVSGWRNGNDTLFCVRLSDGYYFPAPNSQFVQAASYKLIQSQCQYICEDPQMAVYELTDLALETEEMVSVDTRKPYKDLSTAFAYRNDAEFKTCDSQRYNQRVNEARASAMTPTTVGSANVVLPLPVARPDIDPVMAYSTDEAKPRQPVDPLARKVRIVGAPFLPNDRPTHDDLSTEQ
jgi:hypothetical protein